MKRPSFWAIFFIFAGFDGAHAFMDFEHSHFVRVRYESKRDYNFSDAHQSYFLTLMRSHFKWKWNDRTFVSIQAQDARLFDENQAGFPSANGESAPNSLEDRTDLHEAFVSLPLSANVGQIMVGRQRLGYSQGRYLTSPGWRNASLAFDGARLRFGDTAKKYLDVIAVRPAAVRPRDFNDWAPTGNPTFDSKIYGFLYEDKATLANHSWVSHLILRDNSANQDEVYSLMGRWVWRPGDGLHLQAEAVQQWGDFAGLNHDAQSYGVKLQYKRNAWNFSSTFDFASGDADPTDDNHETFENLYPANHNRYGLMDFFSLQNMYLLGFSVKNDVGAGWQLRLDAMSFWLAEADTDAWYSSGKRPFRQAPNRDVDSHVGHEIDLVARWRGKTFGQWSTDFEIGYGHFFGGDYINDTGLNETDPTFIWSMCGMRF